MRQKTLVILTLTIAWITSRDALWAQTKPGVKTFYWDKVAEHADFPPRDSANGLVYDGKFVAGGAVLKNDVWRLSDGKENGAERSDLPREKAAAPISAP